jgi:hypothetical protein
MSTNDFLGTLCLCGFGWLGTLGCGASNTVEIPKQPVPMPTQGPSTAEQGLPAEAPAEASQPARFGTAEK